MERTAAGVIKRGEYCGFINRTSSIFSSPSSDRQGDDDRAMEGGRTFNFHTMSVCGWHRSRLWFENV